MSYPYIIWITAFIVAPMLMILLYAFTRTGNEMLTFQFTLDNFARFFQEPTFIRVLWISLRIAFLTTVFCILIGYPAALFIANLPERRQTMMVLLLTLPMWINMLLKTYAWRGILLNFDLASEVRVFIGMVYDYFPYMVLPIYSVMAKLDVKLLEAASDLGCPGPSVLRRVIWPLSIPGVLSGVTMVLIPSISTFYISQKLGNGKFYLIGDAIEGQYTANNLHFAAAIAFILMVVLLVAMAFMQRGANKKAVA